MNSRNDNLDENTDPFHQLNAEDQKAAIDVGVAAVLIGIRIPTTGKPLYDYVATEFTASRGLPRNTTKYALRSVGRSLMNQDWTLVIEKEGGQITTKFIPATAFPKEEED